MPNDSTLYNKVNQIASCIYPILGTIGSITNILNMCILTRRAIRISPCTYYFFAFACSSLLYVLIRCTTQMLRIDWPTLSFLSDAYCKIEGFTVYLFPVHATSMLVLASFDRYCASSYREACRSWSQIYVAKRIILFSTIVILIYFLPFLFLVYLNTTTNDCYQDSTMINILYLSSRVIILYVLLPIGMMIFGFLTIRHIRHQRTRIASVVVNPRMLRLRRNEGQLARMLLVQVGAYVIFSLPAAITYPMISFIPSMNTPTMMGIRSIALIWQLCIFIVSFIIYTLSSQIYRNEFIRMLKLRNDLRVF